MHPMPSELSRALAEARDSDLRRQVSGPGRPDRSVRSGGRGPAGRSRPPAAPVRHAREAAGWWLVAVGLRLAGPAQERPAVMPVGR